LSRVLRENPRITALGISVNKGKKKGQSD